MLTSSDDTVASLASPQQGVAISFASNQPGMQGWSGTEGTYDGSDARKKIHGGTSTRGRGDGYSNEVSGAAFAMEFHGSKCRWSILSRDHLRDMVCEHISQGLHSVYGAWLHPDLAEKGWNTILKEGQIYNNCE